MSQQNQSNGGTMDSNSPNQTANANTNASNNLGVGGLLTGSNLAASALSSAALVTENVTNFGIKNFSLFGLFIIPCFASNLLLELFFAVFFTYEYFYLPEDPLFKTPDKS
jgi:hypothetical protein